MCPISYVQRANICKFFVTHTLTRHFSCIRRIFIHAKSSYFISNWGIFTGLRRAIKDNNMVFLQPNIITYRKVAHLSLTPSPPDRLPQHPHITGLHAATLVTNDVVLHTPVVLQRAVTVAHNGREVDVCIDTILTGYEAITPLIVKPFHPADHTSLKF